MSNDRNCYELNTTYIPAPEDNETAIDNVMYKSFDGSMLHAFVKHAHHLLHSIMHALSSAAAQ